MKYAIADRFPEEARRYAASLTYDHESDYGGLRSREGNSHVCPLGACFLFILRSQHDIDGATWFPGEPDDVDVADGFYAPIDEYLPFETFAREPTYLATFYPTDRANEYWYPKLRRVGIVGLHLFESTGQAVKAATANLEAMAREAGISVSEMRDRLRDNANLAIARGGLPQKYAVAPLEAKP